MMTVLLECINEESKYTIMLYHTLTVLLEYIDNSLQMFNIAINIFYTSLLCWDYA